MRLTKLAVDLPIAATFLQTPRAASAPSRVDSTQARAHLLQSLFCFRTSRQPLPSIVIVSGCDRAWCSKSLDMAEAPTQRNAAFFQPPPKAEAGTLAMLHLKRDSTLPVTLRSGADDEGYAEGAVTNTRFGSFPHSTLIGLEWGSQVRASKVDTGTRGRKGKKNAQSGNQETKGDAGAQCDGKAKRKSDEMQPEPPSSPTKKSKQQPVKPANTAETKTKVPVDAGSGFIHILQPTPEGWTSSLDHRTQVVYTPDYSYILQRLRVRPGSSIIEAGAGSGSFTHAAARAIFSGHADAEPSTSPGGKKRKRGRVFSFEYHEPRVGTLNQELQDHGLDSVVHLTHRDVVNDGFTLSNQESSLNADAIFLDLPAPWLALKHLTRSPSSPLNPNAAVHICTFSPCIEQVMATVTELRKTGWTDISMSEIQNRRIDVRRERVGLKEEGLRGVNASAASVEEAISRLREVETKLSDFHASGKDGKEGKRVMSKQERLEKIKRDQEGRKLYKEGNLVHRTEPEVKTHTSYLVFATLPRAWSEEDESRCAGRWPVEEMMKGGKEGK